MNIKEIFSLLRICRSECQKELGTAMGNEVYKSCEQLRIKLKITEDMGPRQTASILYNEIFDVKDNLFENITYATDLEKVLRVLNMEAFYVNMAEALPDENNPNGISAVITTDNGKKVIYINENEHYTRQRFSVAHEIGHYVLNHLDENGQDIMYRDSNAADGTLAEEIAANRFASTLLLPKELITSAHKLGMTRFEMAKLFQVSEHVVKYRLINLGLR